MKKRPKSGRLNETIEREVVWGFLIFIMLKFLLELEAEELCSEKMKTRGMRVIIIIKQLAGVCTSPEKLLSLRVYLSHW